jgi:hypothetical protein
MPKWTRGQQAIKELATTTPRGCVVDVLLCEQFSGFSTIIDHLVRVTAKPRKDQPVRVIGLQAQSYTHAVTSIVRMAGTRRNTQAGRLAGIWDALESIHAADPRPITFVLEDAHLMASADMERLIIALDYVCRQVACHCRCMLHCCHVSRWLQKEQMYTRVWPRLPERFVGWVDGRKVRHRGRVAVTRDEQAADISARVPIGKIHHITRAGLDALRRDELMPLFQPTGQAVEAEATTKYRSKSA